MSLNVFAFSHKAYLLLTHPKFTVDMSNGKNCPENFRKFI